MNFGFLRTIPCVNTEPEPDLRCEDPAFAEANPGLCPGQSQLIIKPEISLVCALGSTQFGAFLITNGVEEDVTSSCTFYASNPGVVMIGAASGNATGVAQGSVTISAILGTYTATAEMNVIGNASDCCGSNEVAMMVLVDNSRSMSQAFSGAYATRLAYARAAASRFISEVNTAKDSVGLISFNLSGATLLSSLTSSTATVEALVPQISQTQQKTGFYDALALAIGELESSSADLKVVVLISDGEDTSDGAGNDYTGTDNPISLASNFRSSGGIIICGGARAHGAGFALLSELSTGGFFINAYSGLEEASMDYLSGVKGYICAGNCTPAGDTIVATGALNYASFKNWDVVGGSVDLNGNGFFDFIPGNGLFVDLAGTEFPSYGKMVSKTPFSIYADHEYRISLSLAGNQRVNASPFAVTVNIYYLNGSTPVMLLSRSISINDFRQGFTPYSFSFTSPADCSAYISIQQTTVPAWTSAQNSDPNIMRYGMLLDSVTFDDSTDLLNLLTETFDGENLQYIPPKCGMATTWYGSAYAVGTNCYGDGCLDEPVPIQLPDPSPLPDIESGYTPPKQYTSTKQACATCPSGQVNVDEPTVPDAGDLIPAMTDYELPSGEASASSELAAANGGLAWKAFDDSNVTSWNSAAHPTVSAPQWLAYDFHSQAQVASYSIFMPLDGLPHPSDFTFQGSNDGTNWTTLDTQTGQTWLSTGPSWNSYPLASIAFYSQYRIHITAGSGTASDLCSIGELQLFGAASYTLGPTQVCKSGTATSTVSQSAADQAASAAGLALATAELSCKNYWTATESVTIKCPTGTCGPDVTKSSTASSFLSLADAQKKARDAATALAQEAIDDDCTQSNNTQAATIPDSGPMLPFPMVKFVEGMTGTIAKVTVSVIGLSHTWPADIQMFLSHRNTLGNVASVGLMRHCGSSYAISGVSLVFDDGSPSLPYDNTGGHPENTITSGTYAPTYGDGLPMTTWAFGVPLTPATATLPASFTLADLIGRDPNGTWSLWAMDTTAGNSGSISGGFNITITT